MNIPRAVVLLPLLAALSPCTAQDLQAGPIMKSADKERLVELSADVIGLEAVELRVDGLGTLSCDWSNWIDPVFLDSSGREIPATGERIKLSRQDWGQLGLNRNVENGPLTISGKKYERGFGTHSDSVIILSVPKRAVKFRSKVGLDDGGAIRDGQFTDASVRFLLRDPREPYVAAAMPPEHVDPSFFQHPADLEITIWASTPQLFNPTNMDIDHLGRVWIAEGVNYRGHAGRRPEGDRIVVIQDTDGDGVADSSHTFVQESDLVAPLGVAVFGNRVYVSQPPALYVYVDVNRDLKFDPAIDRREVLLSGFNARNHDHGLHSLTAGPDGKFYFNNGNTGAVFTDKSGRHFKLGSPYREGGGEYLFDHVSVVGQPSDDGHVWTAGFAARMDPDGSNVEIIGHQFRNSYEQTLSSYGDAFQSDNDDPPACRVSYLLEYGAAGYFTRDGRQYFSAVRRPGQEYGRAHWRQDDPGTMDAGDIYGGGSPTGLTMYENGALDEKYRGALLACEPGRNSIFIYHPEPLGATFKLKREIFLTTNPEGDFQGSDFVGGGQATESHRYFRPSDITVGPDGALYVCDWYDSRVGGHADHDASLSGTIYRIAPRGFKPQIPEMDLSTLEGAFVALRSPAINTRFLGFNALRRAGEKALPVVLQVLDDPNPYIAARGIWLLPHLGVEGRQRCEALLRHSDPQIRLVAYRALRRAGADILPFAAQMAHDPDPGVRRDVALSLRDLPAAKTAPIFGELARTVDVHDKNALEAIGLGAAGQESALWLALRTALKPGTPEQWDERFARLTWRLWPAAAVPDLEARARSPKLSPSQRAFAVESLAFIDDRSAVDAMLALADDSPAKGEAAAWLLRNGIGEWAKYNLGQELKSRGIYDPDTIKITPLPVPAPAAPASFSVADVMARQGDAKRGAETAMRCTMCHHFEGQGPQYAPDLKGWGRNQPAEFIAEAIINPSADIAHGYDGLHVELKDGGVIDGLALNDADPLIVTATGGVTQLIPQARIASKTPLGRSLMLSADQLGLSAQDVADLIAYLQKY